MDVFDLETDGFLSVMTVIHCINIIDTVTGDRLRFNDGIYADGTPARRDGSVEDGVRRLMEAEAICGHNIIKFDLKAIQKLYPWFAPKGRIVDTLVLSRLVWANLKEVDAKQIKDRKYPPEFTGNMVGLHKLEAWGYRLGNYKGDFKGPWDAFTPEMDDYCMQDDEVTLALWQKVEAKGWDPESFELEMRVAQIISMQEDHGFLFDAKAADELAARLMVARADLEDRLRSTFKPWYAPVMKDGKPVVFTPKRPNKAMGYEAGVPCTKVELLTFNPGSRHHIANRMKVLFNWVPTEFTDSGQPKVDETTLDSIDAPEAKLLVEYLVTSKLLGMVAEGDSAWIKHVQDDGRIHGGVNPNGAVTGRMTHMRPNMAQVPKVKSDDTGKHLTGYAGSYGFECRSLFTVPEDKLLVGCDAEGLELRMLAHYMARFDGGAYVQTVISGKKSDGSDVHSVNTAAAGLRLRDNGKTFIYAYLYGAGNYKLGTVVLDDMTDTARQAFFNKWPSGDERDSAISRLGQRARRRIEQGLPALGQLQALVKEKARRGFLLSLDKRKLFVRSQHSALNTLLQGGGAVVMKKALVLCRDRLHSDGLNHGDHFAFVANVHDEFQMEVDKDLAEQVGSTAAWAIKAAGEAFGLQCPLAGAYDIGRNWAETH
ncbi:MAG: DNA polymerase [Armatimonadaceae bacterium]